MLSRRNLFVIALLATFQLLAIASCFGSDNTAPLKKVLNSKGYVLANPATSWPYAGGFLVANKKSATFIDLPSAIERPKAKDGTADFMAESGNSSFSVGAILTGMLSVIGGSPGGNVSHAANQSFHELKATGSKITLEQAGDLLDKPQVKAAVAKWLANPKLQVF